MEQVSKEILAVLLSGLILIALDVAWPLGLAWLLAAGIFLTVDHHESQPSIEQIGGTP